MGKGNFTHLVKVLHGSSRPWLMLVCPLDLAASLCWCLFHLRTGSSGKDPKRLIGATDGSAFRMSSLDAVFLVLSCASHIRHVHQLHSCAPGFFGRLAESFTGIWRCTLRRRGYRGAELCLQKDDVLSDVSSWSWTHQTPEKAGQIFCLKGHIGV